MKSLPQPVIYIARDLERALGVPANTTGYHIISNYTDFAKTTTSAGNNLLIQEAKLLNTWQLLQHDQVKQYINNLDNPAILVFKNTPQIERICAENDWQLLNPPAELASKVEEKISQLKWLGDLKKYLPNYSMGLCQNIAYSSTPFILQFNRSHTGSSTFLIKDEKQLKDLQEKFPKREVRTAKYIDGPLFTNNNVATKDKILIGNISYQITGLKPFTDLEFATIGNDWALPEKLLSQKQKNKYKEIVLAVGKKLQAEGWRGLYGIDVVVDNETKELYLVEINARQPASTTYESQLQSEVQSPKSEVTMFEAHLMAVLNMDLKKYKIIEIKDGAQVIQRINSKQTIINNKQLKKILKLKLNIIQYNNNEQNTDLLRIQSKVGIMKTHNIFNQTGNKIVKILLGELSRHSGIQPCGGRN